MKTRDKAAARKARIEHFEIPARRPEAAAHFFREAFGWRVEPLPAFAGGTYFTIRPASRKEGEAGETAVSGRGGGPLRGGLGTPEVVGAEHPVLVVHIEGETLEECLARIEGLGGTAVGEVRPVGEMGRYGRFRDPEGNLFGLWQPAG